MLTNKVILKKAAEELIMKKKRGLLFSIWLIVSVALGLLFWRGTDALAGELDVAENTNTGQQYETLAAAVSAASAGDTIKMIADHAVDSWRNYESRDRCDHAA